MVGRYGKGIGHEVRQSNKIFRHTLFGVKQDDIVFDKAPIRL